MKRFVIVALVLAAGLSVVLAAGSVVGRAAISPAGVATAPPARAGRRQSPPRAQLRQFACSRALAPPARAVSVTTVMRPVPGTQSMSLRLALLAKPGLAGSFGAVRGGDLGTWIHPANRSLGQRPGDVWIFDKRVLDLPAPSAYRFRVTFRWSGARGRALGSAQRLSPICRQPELRPDLLVESIAVKPVPEPGKRPTGSTPHDAYTAVIRNAGATGAGPFYVRFQDADGQKQRQVQRLGAHSSVRLTVGGPACTAGQMISVIADPGHQVDDYDRANNSLSVACPASAGVPPTPPRVGETPPWVGAEPRYTS